MAQHICRETAHKLFESPYRCIDSYLSAGNFLILKHDATMRKGLNNEETQGICEAVSFDVTAECDTGFDELPQIWDFMRENDMMDARYAISMTDRFCDMVVKL